MDESDPRSNVHYLSSSENKAWKKNSGLYCTGIAEVMGSYPVQAWISFRPYFHYRSSSIHYCKDHFHSSMYIVGKTHLFVDATSWCTCLYIISWENYWESQIVSHNLTSYQILPFPSPPLSLISFGQKVSMLLSKIMPIMTLI